jgi:hypothetical protein
LPLLSLLKLKKYIYTNIYSIQKFPPSTVWTVESIVIVSFPAFVVRVVSPDAIKVSVSVVVSATTSLCPEIENVLNAREALSPVTVCHEPSPLRNVDELAPVAVEISSKLISAVVKVAPSLILSSAADEVTPSKILSSAVVEVRPSKRLSSVAVTALAEIAPVPLDTIARLAVTVASLEIAIAAEDLISALTIFVIVLLSESIDLFVRVCESVVPITTPDGLAFACHD